MKFKIGIMGSIVLVVVSCLVAWTQIHKSSASTNLSTTTTVKAADGGKSEASFTPDPLINELSPALSRASIITKQMLESSHFNRHPVTKQMARDWIKDYMSALDYRHVIFLQSDVDLATKLYADSIADSTSQGDVSPAFSIFSIFKKRFTDRLSWVQTRLKSPFDFSVDDYYEIDRTNALWPKSQTEADKLWESRVKFDVLQKKLDRTNKEDPVAAVAKHYTSLQKNFQKEYDSETVMQAYLSSLSGLYDPHSQFLGPSALEDFSISTQLSLQGIGAVLSTEDGYCTIKEIVPGGPADLDKRLKMNDRIISVGQGDEPYVDIVDVKLRNAVKLIRGAKGTKVRLKVISASDSSKIDDITLVRDKIEFTAQQASAQLFEIPNGTSTPLRIGVIRLPSFYGDMGESQNGNATRSTTDDVSLLLKHLKSQEINGLILDLRGNGGGLLDEAINLTGLFIDKGPVVQVKDFNEKVTVRSDNIYSKAYNGPMVVLTNRLSASASEIFAGALQNYGRAIIIGDKSTHGKGTVQAVAPLGKYFSMLDSANVNAGALKITIQKFYLPNGHSTQNRGVVPDISLPSPNDFLKIGEADTPHALPWDEIAPATGFKPIEVLSPASIEQLKTRSQQRISTNPLFALLKERIAKVQKNVKEGKISLNESKRSKERESEDEYLKKAKELEQAFAQIAPTPKKFVIKQGNQKTPHVEELPPDDKTQKTIATLDPKNNFQDKNALKQATPDKATEDQKASKKNNSLLDGDDDEPALNVDLYIHETIAILRDWIVVKSGKDNFFASDPTRSGSLVPELDVVAKPQ